MSSLSGARYVYTELFLEIKTALVVQIEREVGEAGSALIGRESPELCDQRCFRVSLNGCTAHWFEPIGNAHLPFHFSYKPM